MVAYMIPWPVRKSRRGFKDQPKRRSRLVLRHRTLPSCAFGTVDMLHGEILVWLEFDISPVELSRDADCGSSDYVLILCSSKVPSWRQAKRVGEVK